MSLSGPVRGAALAALLLHTLAVVWIWASYPTGSRALLLFWSDFPASLLFAGLSGGAYLAASLLAGGALWAAGAGLLAALVGRLARR
ncbi:MAG: hypothetical protein K8H90_08325 [Thermoanaerobaculia bacterium]|nr:hypothetical protein [Thermoanaerobaculia bacterium]